MGWDYRGFLFPFIYSLVFPNYHSGPMLHSSLEKMLQKYNCWQYIWITSLFTKWVRALRSQIRDCRFTVGRGCWSGAFPAAGLLGRNSPPAAQRGGGAEAQVSDLNDCELNRGRRVAVHTEPSPYCNPVVRMQAPASSLGKGNDQSLIPVILIFLLGQELRVFTFLWGC